MTSPDATTKRERRLAAREERKRKAADRQRQARIMQIVALTLVTLVFIAIVWGAYVTKGFGMFVTPEGTGPQVGVQVPADAATHVDQGTVIAYKSRPPSSGNHYPNWVQSYGFIDPAPPPGNWVHNLEHGAVAILFNCPQACPDLVQQLKDLYPTLPLGRNSRGGQPRALILPFKDMDHKIAAVAWGWKLELDELNADEIRRFYESRIDRGPECRDFACP